MDRTGNNGNTGLTATIATNVSVTIKVSKRNTLAWWNSLTYGERTEALQPHYPHILELDSAEYHAVYSRTVTSLPEPIDSIVIDQYIRLVLEARIA